MPHNPSSREGTPQQYPAGPTAARGGGPCAHPLLARPRPSPYCIMYTVESHCLHASRSNYFFYRSAAAKVLIINCVYLKCTLVYNLTCVLPICMQAPELFPSYQRSHQQAAHQQERGSADDGTGSFSDGADLVDEKVDGGCTPQPHVALWVSGLHVFWLKP
jgi:hypothetical protein